jgi:hypothetical protein
MRKTVRTYVLASSLIATLAMPLSAAPATGGPGDFFTRLKTVIVHALDDMKILLPPG